MVGPVTDDESSVSPNTDNIQQQHYRLQLLAQAIEKVESESSKKKLAIPSPPSSTSKSDEQDLIMKILSQQNIAAAMAAAAAAAAQLQVQHQHQHQRKLEPISPPSTSSASSTAESPIDFSSRRSTDDNNECSTPSSPLPNQHLISSMLQNLQSTLPTPTFPFSLTNKNGKPTRPFKAYPREPLMLPLGFYSTSTAEQTNILAEAASRTTPNRKRLAQTQERLKQRLQQQQQQQQPYFISSSGTQILQPPKKRHRTIENSIITEEDTTNDTNNTNESSTTNNNDDDQNNVIKDDAYWERRRKNNEAAKRSRDARRAKEDEIAIRAAILEQENIKLRLEVSQLKQETAKLRCMVYATS
ncbi:hypothetical protein I4U23_020452 [Adineta vaga]|nr:hypothetical protein I4U23_020452 [Adineta vaga]